MHPDATDSSSVRLSPEPGRPAPGSEDLHRRESRESAAAGARGGGSWRGAAAGAVAAVALCCLAPGCWSAGGAGLCALLLRLCLYLSSAVVALGLGTLFALVFRSPRAPPPDFAAAWSRLAGAVRCPLGVSTGLLCLACLRPPVRARRPRGPLRGPKPEGDPAGGGGTPGALSLAVARGARLGR